MSIGYGITIEIFCHWGFHRSCTMGLRRPRTLKMSKISVDGTKNCRAPEKREVSRKNRNILWSIRGSLAFKTGLTASKPFHGPFSDSLNSFSDGLARPLFYVDLRAWQIGREPSPSKKHPGLDRNFQTGFILSPISKSWSYEDGNWRTGWGLQPQKGASQVGPKFSNLII